MVRSHHRDIDANSHVLSNLIWLPAAPLEGQESPRGPFDITHTLRCIKCHGKPVCRQLSHPLDVCFIMSRNASWALLPVTGFQTSIDTYVETF